MISLAVIISLAAITGAGAAALALYRLGVRHERGRQQATEARGYVEARQRMDEVDAGDDPAVLRDWLRERGRQSGSNL